MSRPVPTCPKNRDYGDLAPSTPTKGHPGVPRNVASIVAREYKLWLDRAVNLR